MHGGYGERKFFEKCLSFFSKEVRERGKRADVEEKGPVSRSMEGWEEGFAGLYLLLSLPLVS